MASNSQPFSTPAGEPDVPRQQRRARGIYYTPPEIVQSIVDATLGPLLNREAVSILDPACGAGEFLLAAYRHLAARHGAATARRSIQGVDIDRSAVAAARRRLTEIDPDFQPDHIRSGDALFMSSLRRGSFDCLITTVRLTD